MSFTGLIKEEISNIKSSESELLAELSAYIRNNGDFSKDKIVMTTENEFLVDHIINSLKNICGKEAKVEVIENLNFSKNDLYQITLDRKEDTYLKDLGIMNEEGKILEVVPNYIVGANEEIRGYLRGVFLGVGSINDPKKSRYHMELLIREPQESVFVQKLLNIFDLNAKILSRDKGFMIYIKEAEKISDFLRIIGASKAVMYFEDVRVYRDKKNNTNRLNNMEQANMDRIIETATSQLEDIQIIEENDGVMLLDEKVKEVLEYRKKYSEASLKELAEIISLETSKSITKSGLNHRLRKIKELADSFRKMKKEKEAE